jgi:hypothetical protein
VKSLEQLLRPLDRSSVTPTSSVVAAPAAAAAATAAAGGRVLVVDVVVGKLGERCDRSFFGRNQTTVSGDYKHDDDDDVRTLAAVDVFNNAQRHQSHPQLAAADSLQQLQSSDVLPAAW